MDMDPYCSAVSPPWGASLSRGRPPECGPEAKLWVRDDRNLAEDVMET